MKTRAFTLIELLVVCAILSILAGLVLGAGGGCTRSDGVRTGTVTKFSYKGFVGTKSWEGELVMGGTRSRTTDSGTTAVANVWEFSVLGGKEDALAAKINAIIGRQVKLHYHETFAHNPLRRNTSYIVTDVEEVDPKAER